MRTVAQQLPSSDNLAFAYDWTYITAPYIKNGTEASLVNSGHSIKGYSGGIFSCPAALNQKEQDQFMLRADLFPVWYDDGTGLTPSTGSGGAKSSTIVDEPGDRVLMWEAGMDGGPTNYVAYYPTEDWAWYGKPNYSGYGNGNDFAPNDADCDITSGTGGGWESCNTLPRYRHAQTADFMFADSHVKAIHKFTDFYKSNLHIPGVCDEYWDAPGACVGTLN